MRILLFFPPDVKVCEYMYGKDVSYRFTKTNIIPPLTLAYLAAILLEKGHDVDILDSNALGLSFKEIMNYIKKFNPDIVMATMVSGSFMATLKWVKAIKDRINCMTAVGGIHPTLYPREVLTHK